MANPVTIRIIPLVGDALENGVIVNFDDEDHLSPTRATGMTIVLRVNPSTLPNSIKKPYVSFLSIILGGSDYNETIFEVTFPADEGEEFSINEITAGIQIIDDDIDENLKQHFVVIMEVAGAVNMDLISDTVENVTMCTIVDNDGKEKINGSVTKELLWTLSLSGPTIVGIIHNGELVCLG